MAVQAVSVLHYLEGFKLGWEHNANRQKLGQGRYTQLQDRKQTGHQSLHLWGDSKGSLLLPDKLPDKQGWRPVSSILQA